MAIVIVDYDAGNLRSVIKGFEKVGAEATISRNRDDVLKADALVLPGVGHFADCAANLDRFGLSEPIKSHIGSGRPFLGICVGYQLLFEGSEECPGVKGLSIFEGACKKFSFKISAGMKVPHMGWNQVSQKKEGRLFAGVADNSDFYFVHSYYPSPADTSIVATTTEYGGKFASSVEKGSLFATQFHPEKSQRVGLKVLENFARMAG